MRKELTVFVSKSAAMFKVMFNRGHLLGSCACLLLGLGATLNATAAPTEQTAVFAGGCFWGVDAVFKHVKGVSNVVSGYAGGIAATAHYEQVSDGNTGHAES